MGHAVLKQYIAASIACLGFVMHGTALGWPSPTLPLMEETGKPMRLDDSEKSWMVSLLFAGTIISPIPSGYLMDRFGRKRVTIILSVIPFLGWIMALFATNPHMLYWSRFLTGLWFGIATTIIPMYLGEISEPKIRGALSTFALQMTTTGAVLEYVIGPYVSYTHLATINGAIPIIFVLLFYWMPESPYWYMMKENREDAGQSLLWLRDAKHLDAVEDELAMVEYSVKEQMKSKKTYSDLFATRGNRRGLLIVVMLAIFKRMSGVSGVMSYTSITLPKEGMNPNECMIIMGTVWLISGFISTALVDTLGRRPLLVASCVGCAIAMTAASIWFYLNHKTDVDVSGTYWVPFVSILFYGIFFSIGLGPISCTAQGESFPSNTKGAASAITVISLAATAFVMNKIYLVVATGIGMYFNFVIFAVACIACLLFVMFYVIETKGKTLQDIQEELNSKEQRPSASIV